MRVALPACTKLVWAGVQRVVEKVAFCDRSLLATRRPGMLEILHGLGAASQGRQLPTFQRCMQRG